MRILCGTILAAVTVAAAANAETIFEAKGLVTDKTPGWRFEASGAKGGETFHPLEGWYPDKGGKLVSPRIPLPKANAYYRLSFTASAPVRSYEAVAFYDADDKMVKELIASFEAGDLNEKDAEELYSDYDVHVTYEHSDEYPEGAVLSQDLDSGSKTIEMVVSLGPENGSDNDEDSTEDTEDETV